MAAKKQSSFWLTGRKTAEASVLQKLILYIKKKKSICLKVKPQIQREGIARHTWVYIF